MASDIFQVYLSERAPGSLRPTQTPTQTDAASKKLTMYVYGKQKVDNVCVRKATSCSTVNHAFQISKYSIYISASVEHVSPHCQLPTLEPEFTEALDFAIGLSHPLELLSTMEPDFVVKPSL